MRHRYIKSGVFRLAVLLLIALCYPAQAMALEWQKREIEVFAQINEAVAEAVFKFDNHGKKPVRIAKVMTSCPCVTVESPVGTIQPGEAGTIRVKMDIVGASGRRAYWVMVLGSENGT